MFGIGLKLFKLSSSFDEQRSLNFWWLRNAKHVKFTEGCVMCKKHVIVKKCLQMFKLFKEGQSNIQDENRSKMVSTPEMGDLVNALILADS